MKRFRVPVDYHFMTFGQGNDWIGADPDFEAGWSLTPDERVLRIMTGVHTGWVHLQVVDTDTAGTVEEVGLGSPVEVDRTIEMVIDDDLVQFSMVADTYCVFQPGDRRGRYRIRMRAWGFGPDDDPNDTETWRLEFTYIG